MARVWWVIAVLRAASLYKVKLVMYGKFSFKVK